ncbi:hypothetical protein DFH07DRAFT_778116 [Mycena maculata]|uniref:Uncharacterized protein n=1 Tax=Mycena maculata TaxID=230809 RepID=A0AAD7IER3_9AGAR|nr:hypothetical protein DFH07DRAFT_778116 [Mycena maculata]
MYCVVTSKRRGRVASFTNVHLILDMQSSVSELRVKVEIGLYDKRHNCTPILMRVRVSDLKATTVAQFLLSIQSMHRESNCIHCPGPVLVKSTFLVRILAQNAVDELGRLLDQLEHDPGANVKFMQPASSLSAYPELDSPYEAGVIRLLIECTSDVQNVVSENPKKRLPSQEASPSNNSGDHKSSYIPAFNCLLNQGACLFTLPPGTEKTTILRMLLACENGRRTYKPVARAVQIGSGESTHPFHWVDHFDAPLLRFLETVATTVTLQTLETITETLSELLSELRKMAGTGDTRMSKLLIICNLIGFPGMHLELMKNISTHSTVQGAFGMTSEEVIAGAHFVKCKEKSNKHLIVHVTLSVEHLRTTCIPHNASVFAPSVNLDCFSPATKDSGTLPKLVGRIQSASAMLRVPRSGILKVMEQGSAGWMLQISSPFTRNHALLFQLFSRISTPKEDLQESSRDQQIRSLLEGNPIPLTDILSEQLSRNHHRELYRMPEAAFQFLFDEYMETNDGSYRNNYFGQLGLLTNASIEKAQYGWEPVSRGPGQGRNGYLDIGFLTDYLLALIHYYKIGCNQNYYTDANVLTSATRCQPSVAPCGGQSSSSKMSINMISYTTTAYGLVFEDPKRHV